VIALLFQLAMAAALMLTQSFEAVLEFIQFALTFCSFLTVAGVIVLRYRQPGLPRPYKAWGYPITPFIFLAVTFFVLAHLAIERPLQSFASFCTMLAGLLVYGISETHRRRSPQETH
jgi:APA family basic amino acid/polyamine antiporter